MPRVRTITNCSSLNRNEANVDTRLGVRSVHAFRISVTHKHVANDAMRFENAFRMFFNFSVQFDGVVSTEARFGGSAGATVHAIASALVQSDNKFTVELIRFRLLTNGTTDRCTIARARTHISDAKRIE